MKKIITVLALSAFQFTVTAQSHWPAVSNTARPWTRWWWMGSAVDSVNINATIGQYSDAGLGGVEIVPIYGAKGYESRYLKYLSPQWVNRVDNAVEAAGKHHMGVDIALGTGWPIGGPQVSEKNAATRIHIQKYSLNKGEQLLQKVVFTDSTKKGDGVLSADGVGLMALMAYGADGAVKDLTGKVQPDGTLSWVAEEGNWQLLAAFNAKTRQKVKRAAPGGEGYTLDHFSSAALKEYLTITGKAYGDRSHGLRSFYNDSYEVYGANWTPDLFTEFEKRRGYKLQPYLRELTGNIISDSVARIKSDYRETIAALMLENFARPFAQWAHGLNMQSINQSHGSPGNLLDLYAAVDIAETETFGSSYFPIKGLRRDSADVRNVDPDPAMLKFASSAAHAMGHRFASSETFTWLTEHFKTSWSQCKPEAEQLFLAGINHVFFHGTTYSPADAAWPGWIFYASVNFVPANSLWPHLKGMSEYITRCQSVLQKGVPDNELAIYWPVYDVWHDPKGLDKALKVHDVDDWLHPSPFYKDVQRLQKEGYSFDFVSDRMLQQAKIKSGQLQVTDTGAVYKVLLVPACGKMPLETLKAIMKLAKQGLRVVIADVPADVPGVHQLALRRQAFNALKAHFPAEGSAVHVGMGSLFLSRDILKPLPTLGLEGEPLAKMKLGFIRRKDGNNYYYYIVNHTARDIDTVLPINVSADKVLLLDPQSGREGSARVERSGTKTLVKLQLKSGESVILLTTKENDKQAAWKYVTANGKDIALSGSWEVRFTAGGPVLPKPVTIEKLSSWTEWGDSTLVNFSGTAVYTTHVQLSKKAGCDYLLQLGRLCESARVWVNGKDAGFIWSIPFERRIGDLLKDGSNEIKIEVVNLMANRIRYMDRNKIPWRNYHEINFVNINYKDFNAASWAPQPSGLLGPVLIKEMTAH
ncbi:glycosyl hydrolase [Filimonas effusa]|nr:glycosyl hydrolase [Filimonas effusa]